MPTTWSHTAVRAIGADFARSADTHLISVPVPSLDGIHFYLKDESTHPTGSLKHRLARSLFLYGLCNGWIGQNSTVIEASSGSTAVSEAYFARLLRLPFIAVMPRSTSPEKIAQIEFYGGKCHLVDDPSTIYEASRRLAHETGGHFMDQFTYAERATDWRGNNNIAESIFEQMRHEPHPVPAWMVCGAGTGGTSATIGRYIRYERLDTRLCVADPEHSVFFQYYRERDATLTMPQGSNIEGIGRPQVEPSFIPSIVDQMVKVPDAASLAAMQFISRILGRKCGGSTGTNVMAAVQVMHHMKQSGQTGSVVSLICDSGQRYLPTYYNDAWLRTHGYDIQPTMDRLEAFFTHGKWDGGDGGDSGLEVAVA